MTSRVRDVIEALFCPADRAEVASLIENNCGLTLPLFTSTEPGDYDQVRLSVLKMSDGQIAKLKQQINIAHVDWRDVIIPAGFGFNSEAHQLWNPRQPR